VHPSLWGLPFTSITFIYFAFIVYAKINLYGESQRFILNLRNISKLTSL
jgi:hypothetical protein